MSNRSVFVSTFNNKRKILFCVKKNTTIPPFHLSVDDDDDHDDTRNIYLQNEYL